MFRLISFTLMGVLKLSSHLLYRGQRCWLSEQREESLSDVKLIVFLNHTSLYEPLFIRFAPWHLVWRIAHKAIIPGADITMNRPITGKVLKALLPGVIPITRKKDQSWEHFLSHVNEQVITAILPEGRMMRNQGLDKHGNPMSVRGGVAEILQCLQKGKLLFVYSGGLHHIQRPGQHFPKLFKTIKVNLELVDIADYKERLAADSDRQFKENVVDDMNQRLVERVPR